MYNQKKSWNPSRITADDPVIHQFPFFAAGHENKLPRVRETYMCLESTISKMPACANESPLYSLGFLSKRKVINHYTHLFSDIEQQI